MLPDLDGDGPREVASRADPQAVRLGEGLLSRPMGRARGPDGLRPPLRRHRQLAVHHGVRGHPPAGRVRDPAAVAARRRALHQGGHPAGAVDRVRTRRARRRTDQRQQRAPAGAARVHPVRQAGRQRPGRAAQQLGAQGLLPRAAGAGVDHRQRRDHVRRPARARRAAAADGEHPGVPRRRGGRRAPAGGRSPAVAGRPVLARRAARARRPLRCRRGGPRRLRRVVVGRRARRPRAATTAPPTRPGQTHRAHGCSQRR